jgi:hypothetical protein
MQSARTICLMIVLAVIGATVLAAMPASAAPVEVHGFMLNRIYVSPGETHFNAERIGLQVSGPLAPDVKGLVEWYYHNWAPADKLWLESAYVDFNLCEGRLRAGRGRNIIFGLTPTGGMRKTSEYGLVSETFTLERIEGVQYTKTEDKGWGWGVGVYNGYSLGQRPTMDIHVLEHAANPHLTDRENSKADVLEVAGRLSRKVNPELEVGVSARGGDMSITDLGFLHDHFNSTWTSRSRVRYGLDAVYRGKKEWMANAELYLAKTSEMDHVGWALLVGHEPKNPHALKAYARYGVSDLDLSAKDVDDPTDPLTFDHQQLMLSVIQPLRPGVWLEYAWIQNTENTLVSGVSVPENDVGFVELFAAF